MLRKVLGNSAKCVVQSVILVINGCCSKCNFAYMKTKIILAALMVVGVLSGKTEKTMKTVFWMNWHLRVFIRTFPSLHLLRHQRVRHYRCLGRKTQVTLRANAIDLFMYIP